MVPVKPDTCSRGSPPFIPLFAAAVWLAKGVGLFGDGDRIVQSLTVDGVYDGLLAMRGIASRCPRGGVRPVTGLFPALRSLATVAGASFLLAVSISPANAGEPGVDPYPSTYRPGNGSFAISGATILTGDGREIEHGTIVVRDGRISAVGAADVAIPAGVPVIDGRGKWVSPGIIDVHSHMGILSTPSIRATATVNEMSAPMTPEVLAEHAIRVDDPSFARAREAGVTTVQVLPGSTNLVGGRSVVLRNVPAVTVEAMKMPGAPQGIKMACGENPARTYGGKGQAPQTPMKSMEMLRSAFLEADQYRRQRTGHRQRGGGDHAPARNLQQEALAEVLDGRLRVNIHCYRSEQMAQLVNLSREFGFKISIFHHAVEAYRIADILAAEGIGVAGFVEPSGGGADKFETQGRIAENGAFVTRAGALFAVHSDYHLIVPNLNSDAGRLMALSNRMGWPVSRAEAIGWLTNNPARLLGIDDQTGRLVAGLRGDVVLWNRDPLSIYALPERVFIDGSTVFDRNAPINADSDYASGRYRRE